MENTATTEASTSASSQPVPDTQQTASTAQLSSTPFSQLAKKEAELVRNRRAFKREQETLNVEKQKLQSIQKTINQFEETKKTDPVAALKMIGFNETDIFNYMAANEKKELSPEERAAQAASQAAEQKIRAFEEAQQKKLLTEQQQRDNNLINGFRSDLSKTIDANKDTYEYCAYYGPEAAALAYEITLAVVKESKGKEVLSPKEAIQMAEEYFEQKDQEMNALKKRQARLPQPPPKAEPTRSRTVNPPADPQYAPKPTITRQRTLTNAATAIGAKPRGPETREQKRERLIAALKNGS